MHKKGKGTLIYYRSKKQPLVRSCVQTLAQHNGSKVELGYSLANVGLISSLQHWRDANKSNHYLTLAQRFITISWKGCDVIKNDNSIQSRDMYTYVKKQVVTVTMSNTLQHVWGSRVFGADFIHCNVCPISQQVCHNKEPSLLNGHECWLFASFHR